MTVREVQRTRVMVAHRKPGEEEGNEEGAYSTHSCSHIPDPPDSYADDCTESYSDSSVKSFNTK